jgi:hypothetical protein
MSRASTAKARVSLMTWVQTIMKGVSRSVALRAISRMVRSRAMRLKPTLVASQLYEGSSWLASC